jgi:hypothetical protein
MASIAKYRVSFQGAVDVRTCSRAEPAAPTTANGHADDI